MDHSFLYLVLIRIKKKKKDCCKFEASLGYQCIQASLGWKEPASSHQENPNASGVSSQDTSKESYSD